MRKYSQSFTSRELLCRRGYEKVSTFGNDIKYGYGYYGRQIGTYTRSIQRGMNMHDLE